MLNKKTKRGLCPFSNFKECRENCVFYRKGVRFNEQRNESYPFEDCAINVMADNIEAMHTRSYMMQKELGEVKDITTLKTMVDLHKGDNDTLETLRRRLQKTVVDRNQKKISNSK